MFIPFLFSLGANKKEPMEKLYIKSQVASCSNVMQQADKGANPNVESARLAPHVAASNHTAGWLMLAAARATAGLHPTLYIDSVTSASTPLGD